MDYLSEADELLSLESLKYREGFCFVAGIDEVGRGPLAGPVVAAAVILPQEEDILYVNDSKKVSEKRREKLYDEICEKALAVGVGFAHEDRIDEINVLQATFLVMERAMAQLSPKPELALIDGNRTKGIDMPSRPVVKGDAKCADIAAASVLAKVTRDRYMLEMAALYPQYGFEQHKGYGTAQHYAALLEYGPSPIHRLSFLKKLYP